jgi:hypothetical protein
VSPNFARNFQTLCFDLYAEVHLQFASRDAAVWRLTSADRQLRRTVEQIEQQLDARQIGSGYAVNLLVLAIEHYVRAQQGRKPLLSTARLQRALATFIDLEMRNYFAHLQACDVKLFADANAFRAGFIQELQAALYIRLETGPSGEVSAIVTDRFRDRMHFPREISPHEAPISFELTRIFRKG